MVPSAGEMTATGSWAKCGLMSRWSVKGPSGADAVACPSALFGRHAASPQPCLPTKRAKHRIATINPHAANMVTSNSMPHDVYGAGKGRDVARERGRNGQNEAEVQREGDPAIAISWRWWHEGRSPGNGDKGQSKPVSKCDVMGAVL